MVPGKQTHFSSFLVAAILTPLDNEYQSPRKYNNTHFFGDQGNIRVQNY